MTETPKRIVWSEGMLISPQHLQQQTLYQERLLDVRLTAASSYSWGISSLRLDMGALAAGQVAIDEMVGVLPGGTPIAFGAGQGSGPPARPLGDQFSPTQKELLVYVAVAREREGVVNVATGGEPGAQARFVAVSREVADLTDGRSSRVSVAFAEPNPVLLLGPEATDDFDRIPIARIIRDSSGELLYDPKFVPTCLRIDVSPFIMGEIQRVLGLAAAKHQALGETVGESSKTALKFQSTDITAFLQLSSVGGTLPLLNHLARSGNTPPFQAYILLTQIAGQLSAFSPSSDPSKLPIFDFSDLKTTFGALFSSLTELLSTTMLKRSVAIPLKLYKNGVLVGELQHIDVSSCKSFIMTAKVRNESLQQEKVALEVPKLSKIATRGTLKGIVRTASNGVALTVTHHPPPEIPVRTGVVYFTVNTEDPLWKEVAHDKNIAIFVPAPYSPEQVTYELHAIPSVPTGT